MKSRFTFMSLRALSALALWAISPLIVAAPADGFWDRFQVHGFASQAMVKTTENHWFGNSNATSYDFTEIGLNASVRVAPNLLVSGQVLSRRAGDMYDGTPALDYGLVDWSAVANAEWRLGLRLGRLKNPLGLYNETRDVPFTRPSIFLPQVVYQDRVRNLILSTDGAMLYGEHTAPFGTLSLTLGYGQAVIDNNVEWTFLSADFPGSLESGRNSALLSFWYNSPDQRLRLGLSGASLGLRFDPKDGAPLTLDDGDIDVLVWIASAQYNAERWSLAAEYARQPMVWQDFGPLFMDINATSEGFYVQGTVRPRDNWELVLRVENAVADRADRSGARFARATGGAALPYSGFTRGVTAGVRWDFLPNWMLRAEYSVFDGTYLLSQRENPDLLAPARHWDLFALLLAWRF